MTLGKKIQPPAPAAQPKYKPHPTNPHIRIDQQTGKWETIQPLPASPVWPFPMPAKP
jgi:hypothetical protein